MNYTALAFLLLLCACSKGDDELRFTKGASSDPRLVENLMRDRVRLDKLLQDCPVTQRPKTVECASALKARHNFMYILPKIEMHNGFTGKL